MSGLTIYEANNLLAFRYGSGNPPTLYIALCESSPNPGSNGLSIVEPNAAQWANYARVGVANDTSHWPAPQLGQVANGAVITFPASPTTLTPPGDAFGFFAILDAATAGNLLTYGPLNEPVVVNNGVAPSFGVGVLTLGVG